MADCVSDALLDAALELDPHVRFACETLIKNNLVVIAGEASSNDYLNIVDQINVEHIVRKVIREIGYTAEANLGFDDQSCQILCALGPQSENIAEGIGVTQIQQADLSNGKQGAGDQGTMFGYAVNENEVCMPAAITYAHRLMQRQAEVLRSGKLEWLRPDAKSQVTLHYDQDGGHNIHTVVISTQHAPKLSSGQPVTHKMIREAVEEEIIQPVLGNQMPPHSNILVNPAGSFVIGGPVGDCGLCGRKIIVDTYGGMARHGGGAFSGKDPSKVDRSGAYAARYVAKNIVASGLANRCETQISYAIGKSNPISFALNTFGTGKLPESKIEAIVMQCFDLTPGGIIEMLNLKRPIYRDTAAYGHFGREEQNFSWEALDKVDDLLRASKVL